ncbi:MAG: hypothetical protein Q9182_005426 [Xanthomendoza sp. 2 TL-2023]
MGRYVPPDQEGTISANKLAGKYVLHFLIFPDWNLLQSRHALGSRARKAGQGILTVRFEMPFAIWCSHCPKPTIIGQGVRFNAEKKKVGNYHSTPIFSFRMKHNVCGGWIEIRTDPKNTAYVVVEGAKKRDTGEHVVKDGDYVIQSPEEKERMQSDAFAALEGRVEEKKQVVTDKSRIEGLYHGKERDWDDPYGASKRLRKTFRLERKMREQEGEKTEALKDRMSLGMDLLPEIEADKKRAAFVDFGLVDKEDAVSKARSKPLFSTLPTVTESSVPGMTSATKQTVTAAPKPREYLQKELDSNTRAAVDPFLNPAKPSPAAVPLIKRKKPADSSMLVDYESDSC